MGFCYYKPEPIINLLIPTKLPKVLAASLKETPVSTKVGIASKTFKTGPCLCYLGTKHSGAKESVHFLAHVLRNKVLIPAANKISILQIILCWENYSATLEITSKCSKEIQANRRVTFILFSVLFLHWHRNKTEINEPLPFWVLFFEPVKLQKDILLFIYIES